jgi:hypothetical protein
MGYFEEVLDAMLASDPGARTALRQTRELSEQVEGLRRQIVVLQRTVATLAAILEEEGIGGSSAVRSRVAKAMRRARESFDEDAAMDAPEDAPAVAQSAYRGAMPGGGPGCAVCGKALEADDPELTLAARGRVCVGCFQRGGA